MKYAAGQFSNRTIFAVWMRRSGCSAVEVCETLGFSTPHYIYILTGRTAKRLGVSLKKPVARPPSKILDDVSDEVMASLLCGESMTDISLRIGISHESLRQWIQERLNVSTAR